MATPPPVSGTAAPAVLPHLVNHVPEQILVKPKAHVSEAAFQGLIRSHGALQLNTIHQINVRVLHVPAERLSTVLSALQNNPNIEFAEPDYVLEPNLVPNDPYYTSEWHLPKISAPAAWDLTLGNSNLVVAILDSGVDGTHPDLSSLLIPGWNFYDTNSDTTDVNGHGTAVAGAAVASSDNGLGVTAVAWNAKILPIRVTDTNGNGFISMIANGLSWAADQGARVANISFTVSTSPTVTSAAQYFQSKGGVVTAAAGNNGLSYTNADNPYILTVSATDANDLIATWSTTGSNIDLCAPGVGILTTARGGGYASGSGTSFAAPIVAGVAALVLSVNPGLSGPQVQDILKQSADDLGTPGWDTTYGYGRVNAYNAVLAATNSSTPTNTAPVPDTTPPAVAITAPATGSTLAGQVTVQVSATDNVGVARVEWYLNSLFMGSSSATSASFAWDTTTYANGSYSLQAKACDAAGNAGTSVGLTVVVQNVVPDTTPPTVQILSPAGSATLLGLVSINVSSSDNVGVTQVEWYLDNALAGSSTRATPAFSWDTGQTANGSHTLLAKAYDAAGNIGSSPSVTVNVQNSAAPLQPPSVQITSPGNSTTITSKTTKVYAAASDTVGVVRADLIVDGKFYTSLSISPPAASWNPVFTWNTSKLARGSHTLQSAAYDSSGNTNRSAIVTVHK